MSTAPARCHVIVRRSRPLIACAPAFSSRKLTHPQPVIVLKLEILERWWPSALRERVWSEITKPFLPDLTLFVGLLGFKAHAILAGTYLATSSGNLANGWLLLLLGSLLAPLPTRWRRGCYF